jgi:malonate decarboxylase beta subunit
VDTGLADVLVADDTAALRDAVQAVFRRGRKPDGSCRSAQVELFAARLAAIDPEGALDPAALPGLWSSGGSPGEERSA